MCRECQGVKTDDISQASVLYEIHGQKVAETKCTTNRTKNKTKTMMQMRNARLTTDPILQHESKQKGRVSSRPLEI